MCILSVVIAIIPNYFAKCTRTLLNLNCKGSYSSSESEIKFCRSQVLRKTRNKLFSRPSRAKTAKRDALAKLLFRLLNLLIFQRFCGRRVVES